MDKDSKIKIKVQTVPNGYTLDIHKDETDFGYLYFTLPKLLEGFIYHIGLEEMRAATKEKIHDVIEASLTWRDKRENVLTILQMNAEVQAMKERLIGVCNKIDEQRRLIDQLREKNTVMKKVIREYEEENEKREIRKKKTNKTTTIQ